MSGGCVLVTGAAGSLGRYLREFWPDGAATIVPLVRTPETDAVAVDLASLDATLAAVRDARPSIVIHAAALADVDACQRDANAAFRANVEVTRNLRDALERESPDARLIYISTDQMYPGPGPSAEDARPAPASVYALTKLWGEEVALARPGSLVVRLNYVGRGTPARKGLAAWLVETLRAGRPATLFTDVRFNPAFGGDVPGIVAGLVAAGATGRVNVGGGDSGATKADFLITLARRLNLPTASVTFGELGQAKLQAPRSMDTRMDCTRAAGLLGRSLPTTDAVIEALAIEFERTERYG
jgi:dTDP-4-dehydrorhamnose reductase